MDAPLAFILGPAYTSAIPTVPTTLRQVLLVRHLGGAVLILVGGAGLEPATFSVSR